MTRSAVTVVLVVTLLLRSRDSMEVAVAHSSR
jgi:hypothetical protein